MLSPHDFLLGRIGIEQGMFNQVDLKRAQSRVVERASRGQNTPLSVVLKQLGILNEPQRSGLERAARYRADRDADRRLGSLMVESGYAEQAAVDGAMREQKTHYSQTGEMRRLGDLLIGDRLITPAQRMAAEQLLKLQSRAS